MAPLPAATSRRTAPSAPDHDPVGRELSVGDLRLCSARHTLFGPHGHADLDAKLYALAERLMRTPGALVEDKALIAAMHLGATWTPDGAALVLRRQVQLLRGVILVLTRERVQIRTEQDVGCMMKARR